MNRIRTLQRAAARGRGDSGLAIIELAIVAPMLALLVAGIIEFGTAWRDDLTISSGTRAAARVVSGIGDGDEADLQALLTLEAALDGLDHSTIQGVLIFEGSAADGRPAAACFNVSGNPQSSHGGNCNYYTALMLDDIGSKAGNFSTGGVCGVWDQYFCPATERSSDQMTLTDVGVWVRIERGWFTQVFPGDGLTMESTSVMRVEPRS